MVHGTQYAAGLGQQFYFAQAKDKLPKNYKFVLDDDDVLEGRGQFESEEKHKKYLTDANLNKKVSMKVLRKDYYQDEIEKINTKNDFTPKQNYSSGNSLPINKKEEEGFSTFDDGLLFQFPLQKYKHLTYYCKTSTDNLDTCNVKLFKLQDFLSEEEEKKKSREFKPPLS